MKLIVGLGNPGPEYEKNRHNLGFILVDKIADVLGCTWRFESRFKCYMAKHKLASGDFVLLAKPKTFMNKSGESVVSIKNYFRLQDDSIFIVHDDLDLPFLTQKKQRAVGSAGHNGVQNIIETLGANDFWRLRVGIGRPKDPTVNPADWVLKDFSEDELREVQKIDLTPILVG
uniref:Peptidyl-tRNA hydrolase n=1 Tax=candidate division WWE3 bacterium TaxID=2053526 RepID=A0A7C4TQT3_UNCKA